MSESLEGSYAEALKIWIARFKEAQRVIQELEQENDDLRARLNQIEELRRGQSQ